MSHQNATLPLPNEPRQLNWERESILTQQFLQPHLASIEVYFFELRNRLDPHLQLASPIKQGKPYPLGQCLEISTAIEHLLISLPTSALSSEAAKGDLAIKNFVAHGGTIRQIWGDLRGQYFQNAFLFGSLYIDVSNDTVVASKPKVEILPFEQANLKAIRDYQHFVNVAQNYWGTRAFPNHIFPEVAGYAPVMLQKSNGNVQLFSSSDYMVSLNLREQFEPSRRFLAENTLDLDTFNTIKTNLANLQARFPTAENPEQGRQLALAECHRLSKTQHQLHDPEVHSILEKISQINGLLRSST